MRFRSSKIGHISKDCDYSKEDRWKPEIALRIP